MKIFGFNITRATHEKALPASLSPAPSRSWFRIMEPYAGAWQRGVTIEFDTVLSQHAVFACQTLIASDIAKLRVKLVERRSRWGVWEEVDDGRVSLLLERPNEYQTRNQFLESWVLSKLQHGNAYVLKGRDAERAITSLYILDPRRVVPLVSDSGAIFYRLDSDHLSGIDEQIVVPASEIIHDRFNCFHHPLVGISPIYANGLTATQGLTIQRNATKFFENAAMPGGILTAPAAISDETAGRLKEYWEGNFSGEKSGRIAVLGDGLKFERMAMTSVESQMIEQLKWTAEVVCSTYHVPPYKIGVGAPPSYNNIQALNVEYYSQCLQGLIEAAESCLDAGLGLDRWRGVEFDLDGLLRMDTVAQITALKEAVGAAVMSPNEARRKIDLPPVAGGDSPLAQQQNFSLAALAKRDAKDDPFATSSAVKQIAPPAPTTAPAELALLEERIAALEARPAMKDAGVWMPATHYEAGDLVTFGGSGWVAKIASTGVKPGDGAAWRLFVKKGRDARDQDRGRA